MKNFFCLLLLLLIPQFSAYPQDSGKDRGNEDMYGYGKDENNPYMEPGSRTDVTIPQPQIAPLSSSSEGDGRMKFEGEYQGSAGIKPEDGVLHSDLSSGNATSAPSAQAGEGPVEKDLGLTNNEDQIVNSTGR